jgi:hypothetical protein
VKNLLTILFTTLFFSHAFGDSEESEVYVQTSEHTHLAFLGPKGTTDIEDRISNGEKTFAYLVDGSMETNGPLKQRVERLSNKKGARFNIPDQVEYRKSYLGGITEEVTHVLACNRHGCGVCKVAQPEEGTLIKKSVAIRTGGKVRKSIAWKGKVICDYEEPTAPDNEALEYAPIHRK